MGLFRRSLKWLKGSDNTAFLSNTETRPETITWWADGLRHRLLANPVVLSIELCWQTWWLSGLWQHVLKWIKLFVNEPHQSCSEVVGKYQTQDFETPETRVHILSESHLQSNWKIMIKCWLIVYAMPSASSRHQSHVTFSILEGLICKIDDSHSQHQQSISWAWASA